MRTTETTLFAAGADEEAPLDEPAWITAGRWFWLRIIRPVAIGYLFVLLILSFFETRLLFPGPKFPSGEWSHGPEIEEVDFTSADGTKLNGWYRHVENPQAVMLLCHGNAENVSGSDGFLEFLAREHNVAAFAFDYRGYGKSEGSPDEAGIVADARAARAWLAKRNGIREDQVVLFGRSLGGGVAVDLATDGARGLILQSTFTSMPDVAAHHVWFAPVRLLIRTQLDSRTKIKQYRGPLLMSHSQGDEVVPYALGRELFDVAQGEKQFVEFNGLGHNSPQPNSYYQELAKFLQRLH